MQIQNQHPTLFMLDLEPVTGGEQETLINYIEREPDCDVAFCHAWQYAFSTENAVTATQLLELLDKIQKLASSHMLADKDRKADGINCFGFSKWNADEDGIADIVKNIWVNGDDSALIAHFSDNDKTQKFGIDNRNCFILKENEGNIEDTILFSRNVPNVSNTDSLKVVTECLLNFFRMGSYLENNDLKDRVVIHQHRSVAEREIVALQIFNEYLEQISKKPSSDERKIEIIAIAMRAIEQLHIYNDCNARSVFILSNWMLLKNDLKLFYPENMCLFDGNSISAIVNKIILGQERFVSMFGDERLLEIGLKNYKNAIDNLFNIIKEIKIVKSKDILLKAWRKRNLNLILRQSATHKDTKLIEFLLINANILNIDINSRGTSSGSALDIAIKINNQKVIELLKKYS